MPIPKFNELYKEVLTSVSDGKNHSTTSICDFVAKQMNIADDECNVLLKNGKPVLYDRMMWARTYLSTAGLIEYPSRGMTKITDDGKKVLQSAPKKIDNDFLKQFPGFLEFINFSKNNKNKESDTEPTATITPTEQIENAFTEISASLANEILTEILNQSSTFFERLVVKLLIKMGYGGGDDEAGSVTPPTRDGGIDGIIREDKLGFSNIYIQAKRYDKTTTVSSPEIQQFIGAISSRNENKKGLFITSGKFSDGAKKVAENSHIILIDGNRLCRLMIEYTVGVSTTQTYELKKIDTDFFND